MKKVEGGRKWKGKREMGKEGKLGEGKEGGETGMGKEGEIGEKKKRGKVQFRTGFTGSGILG